jgi:hypothetical protein
MSTQSYSNSGLDSRSGTFADLACRLKTSSYGSGPVIRMHTGLSERPRLHQGFCGVPAHP